MSDNGFRVVALNGLALILLGMFVAGFPLVFVVTEDVYHQAAMMHPGGDYRGWMMAHLEGLLNGMLIMIVAAVTRVAPMTAGRERWLVPALLVSGWGNTIASILAPVLAVRGMTFDAHAGNNLVAGIFTLALVAAILAMAIAIRHLAQRR